MTIQQLEYFIGIVENTSMNKAAEMLHISQSSLSLSMNKLEKELNTKLFQQKGRYLQLTEAGSYFFEQSKKILQEIEQLEISVKHFDNKSNAISIASDAIDFSTEILIALHETYPAIHFYHYRELNHNKAKHYIDIGAAKFLISHLKEISEDYVSEVLFEEPYVAAVSNESELSKKKSLSIAELKDQIFITLPMETTNRYHMEKIFREAGVYPKSVFEVNDPETTLLSVLQGQGIAFVPLSVVNSHKDQKSRFAPFVKGYSAKPIKEDFAKRVVYLTFKKSSVFNEDEAFFLDFVRKTAAFIARAGKYPNIDDFKKL